MYDGIAQQSPTLPPGVQLPEVLEGASEGEVAEVLASIPPKGEAIKAHQLIAAGGVFYRKAPALCSAGNTNALGSCAWSPLLLAPVL